MQPNREVFLCRYQYNALDQLVDCSPSAQAHTRRFYLKNRLITEIQGAIQRSIMQYDEQLLAQHQRQGGTIETTLLATGRQRSVLNEIDATLPRAVAYTPYGHHSPGSRWLSLLGFNGERPDPMTGHYLLGNGYRPFNPVLMCFTSPDSWSPFGAGGLNAYAYCAGDPVNQEDRTGHAPGFLGRIARFIENSNNGYNRLAGSARSSISSKASVNSFARTATSDAPVGILIPGLDSSTGVKRATAMPSPEASNPSYHRQLVLNSPRKIQKKVPRLERAEAELNLLNENPQKALDDLKARLNDDFVPEFKIQIIVANARSGIPSRMAHLREKIKRLDAKVRPYVRQ